MRAGTFKFLTAMLVACALSVSSGLAKDAAYVSPEQTRGDQILISPPAPDSGTTRLELAELHRLQKQRTPDQAARAKADDEEEDMFIFRDLFPGRFAEADLPAMKVLSDKIKKDEEVNSLPLKAAFARKRPYNLDKTLAPVCKTKTKDDSYPSGHTIVGYLMALTLVQIVPERRDDILTRAADYAHNRQICGVHYASDLEASRLFAYHAHAMMQLVPAYQADLAAARKELRQTLGLPAID